MELRARERRIVTCGGAVPPHPKGEGNGEGTFSSTQLSHARLLLLKNMLRVHQGYVTLSSYLLSGCDLDPRRN
jgi:hypothetical protein